MYRVTISGECVEEIIIFIIITVIAHGYGRVYRVTISGECVEEIISSLLLLIGMRQEHQKN